MGSRSLGWVVLVAASCGGGAVGQPDAGRDAAVDAGKDPNDGARSGSRLKLTWFDFIDGTRQWNGFYDAERKENCYIYAQWADGKAYCVPDANGGIVYTNSACTQKVAQVYHQPGCTQPPPSYFVDYSQTACSSTPTHLYARGAATSVGAYYYKNGDGSCGGPYTITNEDYYLLGAEVATTALVQVTLGAPVGATRLGPRFFSSADGMQFPWTLHDTMIGADCYPATYTPGATTASCAPENAAYAAYDHDASCTQPELDVPNSCGATPQFAVTYAQAACPATPASYYTVGAAVAGSPLYYPNGATCVATTPQSTESYFGVGQLIAPAPLAHVPDTAASHRIQLIHDTTADGVSFRDYALFDSQEGAECYPTSLPDGTTRCVVGGGSITTYFRDSGCTNPVDLVEIPTGPASCAPPVVPLFARKYIAPQAGSCAYTTEVHPIATPYAGAVFVNYGTCVAYTPNQAKLYAIGAAVPLTDFVSAAVVTDP